MSRAAKGSRVTGGTTPAKPKAKATKANASKAKASKAKAPKAKAADDVVLLHSRTEDGQGVRVLRKKGQELSVGEVRPLKEGQPIYGDVVRLKARDEHPALFDVETEAQIEGPAPDPTKGRSRVSTDRYRSGWESLWGRRKRRKSAKPN